MANTVVVKMKAVRITPGTGSTPETVELEEVLDSDVAKSNIRNLAIDPASSEKVTLHLPITSAVGKGQFKQDQAYVVGFTETT